MKHLVYRYIHTKIRGKWNISYQGGKPGSIIASIEDPDVIQKILKHLGLDLIQLLDKAAERGDWKQLPKDDDTFLNDEKGCLFLLTHMAFSLFSQQTMFTE